MRARREVLDEHVGAPRQLDHERPAARMLQVDGDALLPAVDREEVRGRAVRRPRRHPVAAVVAGAGLLDLEHLGAVVAEGSGSPAGRRRCARGRGCGGRRAGPRMVVTIARGLRGPNPAPYTATPVRSPLAVSAARPRRPRRLQRRVRGPQPARAAAQGVHAGRQGPGQGPDPRAGRRPGRGADLHLRVAAAGRAAGPRPRGAGEGGRGRRGEGRWSCGSTAPAGR